MHFVFQFQTYSVFVALNFVCCITGMVITGLSGICQVNECSYEQNYRENFGMAASILVTIGVIFLTCVFGLIILCVNGSHFGISLFLRGQNRIANVTSSSPVSMRAIGPFVIPTGQESDQVRASQNSLGLSLQTQLERQRHSHATRSNRISNSDLPPIRGPHFSHQELLDVDNRFLVQDLRRTRGHRRPPPSVPMVWWPPPDESPPPYSP